MGENQYYAEWDPVLTGLALGCLTSDMNRFPAGRGHIERALLKVWPDWSGKGAYPFVLPRDFGIYGIRSTLAEPLGFVTWDWGSVLGNGIRRRISASSMSDSHPGFDALSGVGEPNDPSPRGRPSRPLRPF